MVEIRNLNVDLGQLFFHSAEELWIGFWFDLLGSVEAALDVVSYTEIWNENNLRVSYACATAFVRTFAADLISIGKHGGARFACPAYAASRLAPDTLLRLEWWFDVTWITIGILEQFGPRDKMVRAWLIRQAKHNRREQLTGREGISCSECACIASIPSPPRQTE